MKLAERGAGAINVLSYCNAPNEQPDSRRRLQPPLQSFRMDLLWATISSAWVLFRAVDSIWQILRSKYRWPNGACQEPVWYCIDALCVLDPSVYVMVIDYNGSVVEPCPFDAPSILHPLPAYLEYVVQVLLLIL